MQQGYSVLTILLIFCSCGPQHNQDDHNAQGSFKDTIEKTYVAIDTQTITTKKQLSMYNEPYELTINLFCLNDSAVETVVQKDSAKGAKKMLKISHNYGAKIILTKNNDLVFTKRGITKEMFRSRLEPQFYAACRLQDIQYEFVRTNRLYFKAILAARGGDNEEIEFAIFYKTEKLGQLDYLKGGPNK